MRKLIANILIFTILIGIFVPMSVDAQSAINNISFGTCNPLFYNTFNFPRCLYDGLLLLLFIILSIMALFLMIAGMLLDTVINYTIIGMKAFVESLTGINTAWKIIKDLMNIAFIFILLFEAIKLIIGQGSREYIKRFIIGIVLAAILINFSLFFTKVLIDASNIVTIGLYDAIIDRGAQVVVTDPSGRERSIIGLSAPFMNRLGLTSFYHPEAFRVMTENAGGSWNMLFIPLLGTILFFITMFVFMAIAIMFIVRFLTLIILLVLSPIAYMGMALDFMKPYASQWWNTFTSQLIFPPVFMLMILVVITLLGEEGFLSRTGEWTSIVSSGDDSASTMGFIDLVFKFIMIIGLTISALTVSKGISTKGSSHIGTATSKLSGFAGGVFMGGAASGMRRTFGRLGGSYANDEELKAKIADGTATIRERLKFAAGTRMANASFDARRSRLGEALKSTSGVDFGSGTVFNKNAGKGGYKKEVEERIKQEQKYAESLKPSDEYLNKKENEAKENNRQVIDDTNKTIKEVSERMKELEKRKLELEKELNDPNNNIEEAIRKNKEEELKVLEEEIKTEKTNREELDRIIENQATKHKQELADIKNIYTNRLNAYADQVENSRMSRYGSRLARITGSAIAGGIGGGVLAGPVGFVAGAVAGAVHETAVGPLNSKTQRSETAYKIRGLGKKKNEAKGDGDNNERNKLIAILANPEKSEDEKNEAKEKLKEKFGYKDEDE